MRGARQHWTRGESLCQECREIVRVSRAEQRKAQGTPERTKLRNKARGRAAERLIDLHWGDFEILWAEEREKLGLDG